jgi:hypothetical protein
MLYLRSVPFGSILLLCIVIYTAARINYSWVTGMRSAERNSKDYQTNYGASVFSRTTLQSIFPILKYSQDRLELT